MRARPAWPPVRRARRQTRARSGASWLGSPWRRSGTAAWSTSRSRRRARAIAQRGANAIVAAYIRQTANLRASATKDATSFLTQMVLDQRRAVEQSELALQRYREQGDATSLEDRQNVTVERLARLNEALSRATTDRIQKETIYNQVKAAQSEDGKVATGGGRSGEPAGPAAEARGRGSGAAEGRPGAAHGQESPGHDQGDAKPRAGDRSGCTRRPAGSSRRSGVNTRAPSTSSGG